MQKTVEQTYKVFDELDKTGQSWNVYIYMMKLGSQAVAELMLGLDMQHFAEVDSRVHEIVHLIADSLHLNKKVTSYGSWYAKLPFGDPKLLRQKQQRVSDLVAEQVKKAQSGGTEDLPLQEAALKAANMVGTYMVGVQCCYNCWLTPRRLCCACNRQQRRKVAERAADLGSDCSYRRWLHNHLVTSVLVDLRHGDLPGGAGETAARTG